MRNQIANLYNVVSGMQSVRETASLLYKRMMASIEYGRKRLKGMVEKDARQEEEKTTEQEEEAEDNIDLSGSEDENGLKRTL